jgi:hypothetical protein
MIVFCTPSGISGYIIYNTIAIEEALYNSNEGCLRKCFEIFQITVEKSSQCQCILSWHSHRSGLQKVKKLKNRLYYRLMHIGSSNLLTLKTLQRNLLQKTVYCSKQSLYMLAISILHIF